MREPGSVTVTLSRPEVEQLRWLRAGVHALDAMLTSACELDSESLCQLDVAGLSYLTGQMTAVCIDGPLNRLIGEDMLSVTRRSGRMPRLVKKAR